MGDWSNSKRTSTSSGTAFLNFGIAAFTALITASVDASERFVTGIYTVRFPLTMRVGANQVRAVLNGPDVSQIYGRAGTGRIGVLSNSE